MQWRVMINSHCPIYGFLGHVLFEYLNQIVWDIEISGPRATMVIRPMISCYKIFLHFRFVHIGIGHFVFNMIMQVIIRISYYTLQCSAVTHYNMQSGHVPVVSVPHFSRFPMMNINIHNISYNLSQWHNRGSSYFVFGHALHDLSLFVYNIRVLKIFHTKNIRKCTKWHVIHCHSSDKFIVSQRGNIPLTFKLYCGLCLTLP